MTKKEANEIAKIFNERIFMQSASARVINLFEDYYLVEIALTDKENPDMFRSSALELMCDISRLFDKSPRVTGDTDKNGNVILTGVIG